MTGFKDKTDHTLNHLFRQESGKMVAVLVKIFGTEHLELAEDVVQDALVQALETWKFRGMPDNPRAWLYRTAKNKAIDIIRRNRHNRSFDFSDPERQLFTSEYTLSSTMNGYWQEEHIQDDFLGMMYACCHPDISPENQITFILKSLCGFSTKEVARSFLSTEDTISKRLYRTKEYFRKNKNRPEIPSGADIVPRTSTVLSSIYLLFNEGYNSTHADQLIRTDLISQAMLLCKSLLDNERTQQPEVFALMALMCFHAARTDSRLTPEGELILLENQNRSKWDTELIKLGNSYLNKAAFGDRISTYHFEAAIASEHCSAKSYENTNWKAILEYYDSMLSIGFDPIVFLNRCIVVMELEGPKNAYDVLSEIKNNTQMQKYHLYHSILGTLHEKLGFRDKAIKCYQEALKLSLSKYEKQFLTRKIANIE